MGGPTQATSESEWPARPRLAFAIRLFTILAPVVSAFVLAFFIARTLPPSKLEINPWLWWIAVFCIANLYLRLADRLLSRLLPIAALFRISLVFPDQAPSRFRSALRSTNSRKILDNLKAARSEGRRSDEIEHSEILLSLVGALSDHDRMTRGHAERVQAYCDLIAEEMGVSDEDRAKLRWGALLHDMGKLEVPSEILNKKSRPDDAEWRVLQTHPAAGKSYVEPLRPWLGDWLGAVDEHHCRWDGKGYPYNLKGTDITLAGRIAAVADAFDVMTSVRSYKKALSAEVGRQELANGAGTQFDPAVVRAFLRIGIGRLRLVAGPLAWLAGATGSVPGPVVGAVAAGAGTAAAVVGGLVGGLGQVPDEPDLAFAEELSGIGIAAPPVSVPEDESVTVTVEVEGGDGITFRVADGPDHGTWDDSRVGEGDDPKSVVWTTSYRPDPDYVGDDSISVEVCDPIDGCSIVDVSIAVTPTQDPPRAQDDSFTVAVDSSVSVAPLANDSDPDGDTLTVAGARGEAGVVTVDGNRVLYRAPSEPGRYAVVYTARDSAGNNAEATIYFNVFDPALLGGQTTTTTAVAAPRLGTTSPATTTTVAPTAPVTTVPQTTTTTTARPTTTVPTTTVPTTTAPPPSTTTTPPNRAPTAAADSATVGEDSSIVIAVLANDSDADGDPVTVTSVGSPTNGTSAIVPAGNAVTYTPSADFAGGDTFTYTVADGRGGAATAAVTVVVTPVNDPPMAAAQSFAVDEARPSGTPVGVVAASDIDGGALTYSIVGGDPGGHFAINPVSGAIATTQPLDFETTPLYSLSVAIGDGTDTTTVLVSTAVNDVNEAPAPASSSLNLDEGATGTTIDLTTIHVDPEGDALTITSITDAGANSSSTTTNGTTVNYRHDGTETTNDTVGYVVTDSAGNTAAGIISVTINPVNDPPVVLAVADQPAFVNIPFSVTTTASDGDGTVAGTFVNNIPPGLTSSWNPGTGEITISGVPARPALGNTYTMSIFVIDNQGALSAVESFDVIVDPVGRSPLAGLIRITEVLYAESDPYDPGRPFDPYLMDEYLEISNIAPFVIDVENFSVTDTEDPSSATDFQFHSGVPPYLPQHTGRVDQAFTQPTPMLPGQLVTAPIRRPTSTSYQLQDGSLRPATPYGSWFRGIDYGFPPGPNSNWEAFENNGDDIWLWDSDGLLVAFVAWDDGSGNAHIESRPPPELGLWDPTHESRLAGAADGQSISLAVLTNNFTSACWERTASGDAAASGCFGAGSTRDVDPPGPLPPTVLQSRVSSQGVVN